jgi:hypothetical protein
VTAGNSSVALWKTHSERHVNTLRTSHRKVIHLDLAHHGNRNDNATNKLDAALVNAVQRYCQVNE